MFDFVNSDDYYNSEQHTDAIYLPVFSDTKPLYIGFFHTGAYQDQISGYGGIKHCLIPSPKHVIVEKDPKTGKLYYEEPDAEPEIEVKMSGEPSLDILNNEDFSKPTELNLDLDGDGVVEEEEIKEVFDKIDTNDDGIIDEEEAKAANLTKEQAQELNDLQQSLDNINSINNGFGDFFSKQRLVNEEIEKVKKKLLKSFNKKKDDDTITYF